MHMLRAFFLFFSSHDPLRRMDEHVELSLYMMMMYLSVCLSADAAFMLMFYIHVLCV